MTNTLFTPLSFRRGPNWKNRFGLAPLTNQQSHADGIVSDDEHNWLVMRALGGFGMTMTAAAHVSANGQGFPGQLGVFDDAHLPGLKKLADGIREHGSVSSLQLHHAGMRSPADLVRDIVAPSADAETGARALSTAEVEKLREDFIAGAIRAEKAGFDGVEIHCAHGYILAQFLSPELNQRTDAYGGSLENRFRLIWEIIDGIRRDCRPEFQVGLRLSPERFGQKLAEMKTFFSEIVARDQIDYIDLSLWNAFKEPNEPEHQGKSLLRHFTDLPRGNVRVGAAGKIVDAAHVRTVMEEGCDFVMIGRAAILRHDFPKRVEADPDYKSPVWPIPEDHYLREGVSPGFVEYLRQTFKMVI